MTNVSALPKSDIVSAADLARPARSAIARRWPLRATAKPALAMAEVARANGATFVDLFGFSGKIDKASDKGSRQSGRNTGFGTSSNYGAWIFAILAISINMPLLPELSPRLRVSKASLRKLRQIPDR